MKIAISLPDDLFVLADHVAQDLGMSRSQLYAKALREFIVSHQKNDLTALINDACAKIDSSLPKDIAKITRRKLLEVEC